MAVPPEIDQWALGAIRSLELACALARADESFAGLRGLDGPQYLRSDVTAPRDLDEFLGGLGPGDTTVIVFTATDTAGLPGAVLDNLPDAQGTFTCVAVDLPSRDCRLLTPVTDAVNRFPSTIWHCYLAPPDHGSHRWQSSLDWPSATRALREAVLSTSPELLTTLRAFHQDSATRLVGADALRAISPALDSSDAAIVDSCVTAMNLVSALRLVTAKPDAALSSRALAAVRDVAGGNSVLQTAARRVVSAGFTQIAAHQRQGAKERKSSQQAGVGP